MTIENLLREIDGLWEPLGGEKHELQVIGSTALMLQTNYVRTTKDGDVLETQRISGAVATALKKLAGKGTPFHKRNKVYIDIVPNGLPFLPHPPALHSVSRLDDLRHFEPKVLDIVDVVVSKLKRFNANDVTDIEAMINLGKVDHRELIKRFESAVDYFRMDARAHQMPKYLENLHTVERDYFGRPPTVVELPPEVEL